jgi:hypothetical protein
MSGQGWYVVIRTQHPYTALAGGREIDLKDRTIKIGFLNRRNAEQCLSELAITIEQGTVGGQPVVPGQVINERELTSDHDREQ